ncbi:MAG: DNA mismatch repair protein MutS [Clostridiales bacterium]|nr:DNA mismatch repair protein MutS [Clostridiales bacterium]
MMRQYRSIKEQYPDALLFFRLGDFYEMFAEDALTGAKELEIVLTVRDGGNGKKIAMCGVPHHAVDNYLAKLIAKGYKVAICEQTEDPKTAKGLVRRDVVRLVTPGTVLESQMLVENQNNYLAALWREPKKAEYGLAYADISTGQFMAAQLGGEYALEQLIDELTRISPAECILPQSLYDEEVFHLRLLGNCIGSLSKAPDEAFVRNNAGELLCTHFGVASAEALGLTETPLAAVAAAMILYFLHVTQKQAPRQLKQIKTYASGQFMMLDAATRRNLELVSTMRSNQRKGSLLWVCDSTRTAMGARLLKEWLQKPLLDSAVVNRRLDGVEEFHRQPHLIKELAGMLKNVYDLERLTGRIVGGSASPKDLVSLKQSLLRLPELFRLLTRLKSPLFQDFLEYFDTLDDVCRLISEAIADDPPYSPKEGGVIRPGYHKEADELRATKSGGKNFLSRLENAEKEATGIKSLKIGYNKVFGYYIEVTNANLAGVPPHYIRKQTLANAERYITEELKEWESKILSAEERLSALEYELFCAVRQEAGESRARIQNAAEVIASLDVLQSLAQTALDNNYCRPQVNDGPLISVKEGRHPSLEKTLGSEHYIPNDVFLDDETQQLLLITGPNMAGKSTYMRQTALIALLARAGSFVPAKSAIIGKIDRIFTRVGASDDLSAGQSTFMVEMCETANILRHATRHSLVVLDEIGRGTSTFDGMSIAWAVAEYLLDPAIAAKTLFATHYHELTQLAEHFDLIKNYSVAVREKDDKVIFLRKIVPGGTDKSYGIQVASLAGLPQAVLQRAKDILRQLEREKSHSFDLSRPEAPPALPQTNPLAEEIAEKIAALDVNSLTPIEALLQIGGWQKLLRR